MRAHRPIPTPAAQTTASAHMRRGGDPNHKNKGGYTALHYAAIRGNGGGLKLLLAGGADPNRKENDSHTLFGGP